MLPRYEFTDGTQDCVRKYLIHDTLLGGDKNIIGVVYETDVAELIVRLLNENDEK